MTHIVLKVTIITLLGFFWKSQAQENADIFFNSLRDQNMKAEIVNSDSSYTNDEDGNLGGFWFNIGLGSTNTKVNYKYNPDDFITFKAGVNFKYSNYLLSFGMDKSFTFPGGSWYTNTYWFVFGYSTNFPHWDAFISIGPSYSTWKYLTENEDHDIINSPRSLGLIIQPQLLIHMRIGVGFGGIFTYNYSKEVKYTSISFVVVFGAWYNKI